MEDIRMDACGEVPQVTQISAHEIAMMVRSHPPPPLNKDSMEIAPTWILAAILRVETGSSIGHFGIVPGKVTRGLHGERGAMQMRRAAFDEVALPGESFSRIESDHELSVRVGNRYLVSLHQRLGSWEKAIMAYNAGPSNYQAGRNYLKKVQAAK